jgi:hypothetical protein
MLPSARLIDTGDSMQTWQGASGTLRLLWSDAGAVEITVRDHGGEDLVDIVTQRMEQVLSRGGRIVLFFDLGDMRSYDSVMRVRWTDWVKEHIRQVVSLDVIARSKLVTMGVAVANLALGGIIKVHNGRAGAYETSLLKAGLPRG